jgi:ATP-dependent helicase/nuclease subunit A
MNTLTLQQGDAIYDATSAAQSLAADPRISIWASANAGAGKTKVLIDRIARLLLAGAQPGRVLAVTYTKAAAAEMQTRLYDKLGSWTIANDADLRAALTKLDPKLDLELPGTLSRARALFARALETPGGLKIQTIHAFCQAILQRFPLEAGVPPGFQILDDPTRTSLSKAAFEIAARKAPNAFLELAAHTSGSGDREAVRAAVTNREALAQMRAATQPVMTRIAGALGLDPNDTPDAIAKRAMARLDMNALSQAASALETSSANDKKLAQAIRKAISSASPFTGKLAAKQTEGGLSLTSSVSSTTPLHPLRGSFPVNGEAAQEAWANFVSLVWTQKGEARAKQIYTKGMGDNAAVVAALGPYDEWPSMFCCDVAETENDIRACAMMRRSAALSQAALVYSREWEQAKRSMGALDFDDLVSATSGLLSASDGAAQWVLYKLDAGIEHILIDEAQDTSPDQWDLLAPLFAALEDEARDTPRTRFVVGDEKQSIFSFQGARPERFHDERARFEAGAPVHNDKRQALTFELSFRTGQTILNAVDAVWSICELGHEPPLKFTAEVDPPFERKYAFATHHSAFRSGQIGAVEMWPLVRTQADGGALPVPAWDQPQNVEREDSARNRLADQIAIELKQRLADGFCVWDGKVTRPMVPGDMMILVRKRGPFFHQLIRRLKFHKVPVAGADRIKLVEDPAIQDLIALGRFALLPEDDFNTACVLKGAFCGLINEDEHLFPLAWDRGSNSLWQRLIVSSNPDHAPARAFLTRVLAHAGQVPPYEFFASLLELPLPSQAKTGWQALTERLGREVREPVEAFLSRALDHGKTTAPTLQAFLSQMETDAADVKREMDQDGSGVRIMTVHGAKGLEAPVVILPDTTSKGQSGQSGIQFNAQAAAFYWSPITGQDTQEFKIGREVIDTLEEQEAARLLYVAMTRAKDVLILCGHESGTGAEGLPKKCWFRTLETGVNLLGPSQTHVRESFTYQMWGAYPPKTQAALHTPKHVPAPLPSWINGPPPGETPGPRRVAPSALAPEGSDPPALSPLAPDARKRFLRGRLIHELLQRLPDLPASKWEVAAQNRLSREADLEDDTRRAIVSETLAVLNDPAFARLFGPGSRAEAAIVGRGPGLPDDMVVNGSVDRLVVTETEVLVLDFKTNRPPPIKVEDVAQVYLNQMAAYRALLQANWPGKRVRCALLWTDGPRLMELPDTILDQALRVIATLPR